MEMQRLCTGMMERYEIDNHRPARVNAVQFGLGEAMLGTVNRLIDDYNAASPADERIGLAAVQAGEAGYAKSLTAQDGMYTLLIRGYQGEEPVRREQVVQCVLRAIDPNEADKDFAALAEDAGIAFVMVDDTSEARALAARFIALRRAAGLENVTLFHLGTGEGLEGGFPMLADSLAFRAEPDEAARQCAEMNYLDDMLHIAEPCARLTLRAPDDFQRRFPLGRVPGVRFADLAGMTASALMKSMLFEAGLFLMAAPGWLNGLDTLRDCMENERLRRFVGEGFTRELMPCLTDSDRAAVERTVIESFERYENPLNRNRILRAAGNLVSHLSLGALTAIRQLADEHFEPPRRLSFALAATIMLYAGARLNPTSGFYEVARGKRLESLHDDPAVLARFSTLSHDMDPESLAYAALADRELWGRDLREIDGLMERVTLDLAAMQRRPDYLPDLTETA